MLLSEKDKRYEIVASRRNLVPQRDEEAETEEEEEEEGTIQNTLHDLDGFVSVQ